MTGPEIGPLPGQVSIEIDVPLARVFTAQTPIVPAHESLAVERHDRVCALVSTAYRSREERLRRLHHRGKISSFAGRQERGVGPAAPGAGAELVDTQDGDD